MSTHGRPARAAAALAAAVTAALATPAHFPDRRASKNFVPDVVFTRLDADGLAHDGRGDVARGERRDRRHARSGRGGWLVADRSYQDVAFFASFRCAEGCATGVLLRAEKTADGGLKGIFASLVAGDLASYRVTLDANGKETSRERLRPAGGGQVRVAPPPAPPPAGAPAAAPARAAAAAAAAVAAASSRCRCPAASSRRSRGRPPVSSENQWNDIELVLDANILRPFLNDAGGVGGGVADEEFGRFGPVALYAGGTGEVRFKDVSFKDLQPRVAQTEQVSTRFRMQALNEFYYSWGPAVADINKDGSPDIVAGPYYYLGPDYNVAREIYMAQTHRRQHAATSTACSSPTTSPATAGPT